MVTRMIFEVRDLDNASPATVSRVSIVLPEPDGVPVKSVFIKIRDHDIVLDGRAEA